MFGLFPLLFSLLPFTLWEKGEAEIVFAGDAMQHKAQIEAAYVANNTYDYSNCFSEIAPYITDCDYAVVNLETPLGGKPYTGYPCFSAPDSYLSALKESGFDLMLAANNHTLDRRDKGLLRTINQFESQSAEYIGIYRNYEHRSSHLPLIKQINGIKIGFLNYTYGTNGIAIQGDVIVDYIDQELIKADVQQARRTGAELIAVCIHWGDEYRLLPNKTQQSLAEFLCDIGVDMIIGGHPHVIQPMELRYNIKHNKNILLVYSLGNFISNMKTRDTRGGAVVKAYLSRNAHGIAQVDSARYRLFFTVPPTKNNSNFHLVPAEKYNSGEWSIQCKSFRQSAEAIFKKHNRNISCDTTTIKQKK